MAGKLAQMVLHLKTGERGRSDVPDLEFNGHLLPLRDVEGSCGSGESLQGMIRPGSVAHTVRLVGPETGTWDIESLRIDYEGDTGSWTVEFEPFDLDDSSSADIFRLPPLPTWEV